MGSRSDSSAVAAPRIGPHSRLCPTCGRLLPQPPHAAVCVACRKRGDVPVVAAQPGPPLAAVEKLFLAAVLLRAELRHEPVTAGVLGDATWERVMLGALMTRASGGVIRAAEDLPPVPDDDPLAAPPLPLGTSTHLVRQYLGACAAAWRARGCPF